MVIIYIIANISVSPVDVCFCRCLKWRKLETNPRPLVEVFRILILVLYPPQRWLTLRSISHFLHPNHQRNLEIRRIVSMIAAFMRIQKRDPITNYAQWQRKKRRLPSNLYATSQSPYPFSRLYMEALAHNARMQDIQGRRHEECTFHPDLSLSQSITPSVTSEPAPK